MSQYTKWPVASGGGGGGSVTSVGLSAPAGLFTVVGSPVTSAGTLTLLLNNEAQNSIFAGPASGGPGSPTFRALVAGDVPLLSYVNTMGAFGSAPNANGGVISGNTLTLEPADGTHPGGVSTLAQSFGGSKTFLADLHANSTSTTAFTVNATTLVVDATNGALGINTAPAVTAVLDIVNNSGSTKAIQATGYGSNVGVRGRRANGTQGFPTQSLSGDILSFYSGRGYGATGFAAASTGAINVTAGENFTDSSMLTYLSFNTTPTGSVSTAESMRVASTGITLGPQSGSTASHKINGALQETINTITAATYSVDAVTSDTVIFTDSTSNAIAITLPAPTAGRLLVIQDKTGQAVAHNITVKQHAAETINGLTQLVIAANYGGLTLTSDGTNWSAIKTPTSGVSFMTSGTTYTTPVNVTPQTRFKFTLIGGGAGGSNANVAADTSTGGGGGAGCQAFLTGLAANTGYSMTVGSAGAGGAAAAVGTSGGSTTISINAVTYTAGGGSAAATVTGNGGAGGTASNGTININGQAGDGSTSVATASSGNGGSSPFGFGLGAAALGTTSTGGLVGTGFGAGGGGAKGVSASTGGAGTAGCILVEWSN